MLVFKRRVGEKTILTHRNGDRIEIWIRDMTPTSNTVTFIFEGPLEEFEIQRAERKERIARRTSLRSPLGKMRDSAGAPEGGD